MNDDSMKISRIEAILGLNNKIVSILVRASQTHSIGRKVNGGFDAEAMAFFNTFSTFYALLLYGVTPDAVHRERGEADLDAIHQLRAYWKEFFEKCYAIHVDISFTEGLFGDLNKEELEMMLDQAFSPGPWTRPQNPNNLKNLN